MNMLKDFKLSVPMRLVVLVSAILLLGGCDKINNANRAMDTMLGGDYKVYVIGHKKIYLVDNGKVTSVPDKGYYVFYATVQGELKSKTRLVQTPIATSVIEKI